MKRLQSNMKKVETKNSKKPSRDTDSDNTDNEKEASTKKTTATKAKSASSGSKFTPFLSLKDSINDKTLQVYKDDRFVCIRDKYPKARVHLLLIPIGIQLLKVQDLIKLPNSLEFLKEMRQLANKIVEEKFPSDCKSKAIIGFHSIQSMNPLHMHIITNDFKSDCLKNKKHWNSFNTPYFVLLHDLIEHLESDLDSGKKDYFSSDKFNLNNTEKLKEYLNTELKCNACKSKVKNMPELKKHLNAHS